MDPMDRIGLSDNVFWAEANNSISIFNILANRYAIQISEIIKDGDNRFI